MEIKITTNQVLKILLIISWIIFLGLCVEAGGFIVNTVLMLMLEPEAAKNLWQQLDLFALYTFDRGYFFVEMLLIIIAAVLKACMFYMIIRILQNKKLNMSQPFTKEMGSFIFLLSYLAFGIGLFSGWGVKYAAWFVKQGVIMPDAESLHLGGSDVWLFMAITLFVLAQIFKKGIEIQTENELTV